MGGRFPLFRYAHQSLKLASFSVRTNVRAGANASHRASSAGAGRAAAGTAASVARESGQARRGAGRAAEAEAEAVGSEVEGKEACGREAGGGWKPRGSEPPDVGEPVFVFLEVRAGEAEAAAELSEVGGGGAFRTTPRPAAEAEVAEEDAEDVAFEPSIVVPRGCSSTVLV